MTVRVGIIGGSGFAEALTAQTQGERVTVDTPFGPPSAPVLTSTVHGVPVCFIPRHGVGHVHAPTQVNYRANVYALKALGCTHVLASGAVGSLQERISPRHVVLVDQFIDRTVHRPRSFFDQDLVVHAEFADPVCPVLRGVLESCAGEVATTVHPRGTYVCMEGPAFSTRAESHLHRSWGADLIGMTALPEARLCREAEMAYALVALVTDYDCWRPHTGAPGKGELLAEIISNLQAATASAIALTLAAIRRLGQLPAEQLASPAHQALALAVWSHGGKVSPAAAERYGVLLERYRRARA